MNGKIHDGNDMMAAPPTHATLVETKGPATAKTKKRKKSKFEDERQPSKSKAQKAQSKRPKNSQVNGVATKKGIGYQQGGGEGRARSDSYHQGEGGVSSSASSITSNIGIPDDKDKKKRGNGKAKSSLLKKKTWVPELQQSPQQLLASSDDDVLTALQRKVENETKKEALAQKLQRMIMMTGGDDNTVSVNVDQPTISTVSERRTKNEMKKDALAQKLQRMMNGGEDDIVYANSDHKIAAHGMKRNISVSVGRPNHGFGQPGKKSPMEQQNASSMLTRSRTEAETKQDDNKSILNSYQSMMTQLVAQEQQQASDARGFASARSSPSQSHLVDDNVIRHLMLQSGEQRRALLQAPQVQESLRWVLQHEMQTNYQENDGDDPEVIVRRQLIKEAKRAAVAQRLRAFMKSEDQEKNVKEKLEKQHAATGKPLPSEQQASSSLDSTTLGAGDLLLALSRGNGQWSFGKRSHEQQDNGFQIPSADSSVKDQQQLQSRGGEEGKLSAPAFQGLTSSGGVDKQAMLMQRLLLQRENNGHAPQQKLLLQRDLDDMNIQLRHQIQNNSQGQGINVRDGGVNLQHTIERNHSDLVRQAAIQSLLTNQQRGEASQQSSMIMNEENRLRQEQLRLQQQEIALRQALALQAMPQQLSAVAAVASTDPDAQALTSEQLAQFISSARKRR